MEVDCERRIIKGGGAKENEMKEKQGGRSRGRRKKIFRILHCPELSCLEKTGVKHWDEIM